MRHFQVIRLLWSMLITCSEKRRLRGEVAIPWKHRSGICCPPSPLWLGEEKGSDCNKGYLTREENILGVWIVWEIDCGGVMAPLQVFTSRSDKQLARQSGRARGGLDRLVRCHPALSSHSFTGMPLNRKCRCEVKLCYWCS